MQAARLIKEAEEEHEKNLAYDPTEDSESESESSVVLSLELSSEGASFGNSTKFLPNSLTREVHSLWFSHP